MRVIGNYRSGSNNSNGAANTWYALIFAYFKNCSSDAFLASLVCLA